MTAAIQITELLHASIWEKKKKRAQIFMLNKWSLSHTHTQWLQDMNNSVLHVEVFG